MRYVLTSLLFWSLGCAHFEYDIVRPVESAAHVGTKTDTVIKSDPLEYQMRAYEDRLVVRVFNPIDESIQLIGQESAVVDPGGQSHPLRSAAIEPRSFIKLILPPPRPTIQPTGPTIGIGLGTVIGDGRANRRRMAGYDTLYDEPRYLTVDDENDATYWTWQGESQVRLALTFQRGGKTFRDEFVIQRVRAK